MQYQYNLQGESVNRSQMDVIGFLYVSLGNPV
jgi:hypothetical protein